MSEFKIKGLIISVSILLCTCSPSPQQPQLEEKKDSDPDFTELFPKYNPDLINDSLATDFNSKTIELLHDYHAQWINDSLAKNGFRQLLANEFLSKCNFEGMKWALLQKYFGKPSYIWDRDSSIRYKYRASYFSDENYGAPGNLYVEIEVKNGVIIIFRVYEIDG
jgi:hypothetical protein